MVTAVERIAQYNGDDYHPETNRYGFGAGGHAKVPPGNTYPNYIQAVMAERGITQTQLAELLGRDNAVITNLFKGNRRLTVEEAQKIADFLGVSLTRLTTGKDEADPFTIDTELYRRSVAIAENYLAEDAAKPRPGFEEFSWMVLRCYHLGMAERKKRGEVSDVQLAMRFVKEMERESKG